MGKKLRLHFAIIASKTARRLMRMLGFRATFLPGKIAKRICPDCMDLIAKPETIIAVTGTNGKTTVSNLFNDVLNTAGHRVLNNKYGSNTDGGILSILLDGVTLFGRSRYKLAVFEIDERSARKIFPYLRPQYVVITNLFRDSIMRNAHPDYIAGLLTEYIPPDAKIITNADDLIASGVAPGNERAYFGIERMETDVIDCVNLVSDIRVCPKCSGELVYEYRRYHHIGKAKCRDCGFATPDYDYYAKNVDVPNRTMTAGDQTGECEFPLISDSIFNIYNILTVIAALREIGLPFEEIRDGFRDVKITESRYAVDSEGALTIVRQMSKDKNALANSRAFDYIAGLPGDKELILMMSCLFDTKHWSENITWLYDCDFEFLNRDNITRIVAAGPRAKDYRLRLLMAGVPEERIRVSEDELAAPRELELTDGETLCICHGWDSDKLSCQVRDEAKRLKREGTGK